MSTRTSRAADVCISAPSLRLTAGERQTGDDMKKLGHWATFPTRGRAPDVFTSSFMDIHSHWLVKHMHPSAGGRKPEEQVEMREIQVSAAGAREDLLGGVGGGQWPHSLPALIAVSAHFPLSSYCYCYYFHRRQEVALSQPNASHPAAYQAVAGCLSWSSFHPNRRSALLMRAWERKCICACLICEVSGHGCHTVEVKLGAAPYNLVLRTLLMTSGSGFRPPPDPTLFTCCDRAANEHPSQAACLCWVTYLPSWLRSMASNCFRIHLHRDGRKVKTGELKEWL